MALVRTRCALCGAENDCTVLYRQTFQASDLNKDVFSARRLPDRLHCRVVRCNKDGLVRSDPVPDEELLKNLYRESSFTYGDEVAHLTATYLDALDGVLPRLSPGARLLEVGCGSGFVLQALHDKGYRNVFGVEPSSEAAEKSRADVRRNITVDVLRPGLYPASSFDCIFFFQTFDHVSDPNAFLAICHGLLAPGGHVVAFNHDVESFSARLLKERSPIIDIEHTYLFSKATMRRIFEKNGFRVERVYSPANRLSLSHLLWLAPLPKAAKRAAARGAAQRLFSSVVLKLKLGNLCLIGQKA